MYTKSTTNTTVEIIPEQPALASVIWLHGLGASGDDFVPIIPELKLDDNQPVRFIFPHAPLRPVTINNGYVMRAWFDIYSLKIDQRLDQEGITHSINLVQELIEKEKASGIPSEKIILAGFSQGSVIALSAGLAHPEKLGGILALSGFLPHAEEILNQANPLNQALPIFIGHGKEDMVVPFGLGEITADVLSKHGYPVTFKGYKTAHTVCVEEISDIGNWLKQTLS